MHSTSLWASVDEVGRLSTQAGHGSGDDRGRARICLAVLDRSGRDVHRRGGAHACGRDPGAQAPVRQSGAVRRRGARGYPAAAAPGARCADPGERDRRDQDGHHGRHQRPARAPRRADHARDHRRPRRRAAHRLSAPPRHLRPAHRAAGDAVRRRGGGRRARARRRHGRAPDRSPQGAARSGSEPGAGAARARHRSDARLSPPCARAGASRAGARARLRPGLGQPSGLAADEGGEPGRYHGGRRLLVADPAALRRSACARARGRPADVHAVERRAGRRAAVPGQGRHPVRAGGRHRRRRARRPARRLRAHHHVRHGRHLDRCRPLRRHVRADLRIRGRGRAAARADDGDPHRGRGRRLDSDLRRRALSRRARNRRAPIPDRRATGAAARSRSPTPI